MERIDFGAKRLKGQCRQKFEPLENLTEAFKFVLIPSVIVHKKTEGIGRTDLKGLRLSFSNSDTCLNGKPHLSWFAVTLSC